MLAPARPVYNPLPNGEIFSENIKPNDFTSTQKDFIKNTRDRGALLVDLNRYLELTRDHKIDGQKAVTLLLVQGEYNYTPTNEGTFNVHHIHGKAHFTRWGLGGNPNHLLNGITLPVQTHRYLHSPKAIQNFQPGVTPTTQVPGIEHSGKNGQDISAIIANGGCNWDGAFDEYFNTIALINSYIAYVNKVNLPEGFYTQMDEATEIFKILYSCDPDFIELVYAYTYVRDFYEDDHNYNWVPF